MNFTGWQCTIPAAHYSKQVCHHHHNGLNTAFYRCFISKHSTLTASQMRPLSRSTMVLYDSSQTKPRPHRPPAKYRHFPRFIQPMTCTALDAESSHSNPITPNANCTPVDRYNGINVDILQHISN